VGQRKRAVEGVVTPAVNVDRTSIAGVMRVRPPYHEDARGSFTKPFSRAVIDAVGEPFVVSELYWSQSASGTIRGMHFQLPPTAVAKLVICTAGRVRDVVLDLRVGSPTFGEYEIFDLAPDSGAVLVPVGCAHGFEVVDGPATLTYLQSGDFDPVTDAGVRWDSFGMAWHNDDPVLSARDRGLPLLSDFDSPFRWEAS
jgi:dTDP-4-dehydrorhamnose 3,5-epimerase